MTVFGWDASDFDWSRGSMNLSAAYNAGIRFFTHKATEDIRTKHVRYGDAMVRARDAGVPILGAYGVPRTPGFPRGTVNQQVDFYLNYVDSKTPWWRDWEHWFFQVDLEHWSSGGAVYDAVAPSVGLTWCARIAELTHRRVVLYAPKWAYGDGIGGDWPLWASNYVSGAGNFTNLYPGDASSRWSAYSGRTPVILQYTSNATIGSQGTCDANAFRGSLDQMQSFVRMGQPSTETEDEDMKIIVAGLTGRDTMWKGTGEPGSLMAIHSENAMQMIIDAGAVNRGRHDSVQDLVDMLGTLPGEGNEASVAAIENAG